MVAILKEKFVCAALDARKERGEFKDAGGDFIRSTDSVTVTASGSVCAVCAGGKRLTSVQGPGEDMPKFLEKALKAWAALPESERKPGAVSVGAPEPADPKRAALEMPVGCLVLRVFNRHLGRNEEGTLRYVIASDFIPGTSRRQAERFAEAQNDFMWIPEREWKALVPADPKVGEQYPVPASFALRLFRFHLDPGRGFSESTHFTNTREDAGRITLTVQALTAEKLTLRLDGHAALQQAGRDAPSKYEPALLGYLEYDRNKKEFTRADLLALGTASGLPRDANGAITPRPGEYPLGIAFELVANPTAAEQLHPRGARDNVGVYLNPK